MQPLWCCCQSQRLTNNIHPPPTALSQRGGGESKKVMGKILYKNLKKIESAKEFFNVDKVLYLDAIEMSGLNHQKRELLKKHCDAFVYMKRLFLPIMLKGSPHNLLLNPGILKTPIGELLFMPIPEGDLDKCIEGGKIFDASDFYTPENLDISGPENIEFIVNKYVAPYVKA